MNWFYMIMGFLILGVSQKVNYRLMGTWLSITGLVSCLFGIGFFKTAGPNYSFLPFFAVATSGIASTCEGIKRGVIFLVAILIYVYMWGFVLI